MEYSSYTLPVLCDNIIQSKQLQGADSMGGQILTDKMRAVAADYLSREKSSYLNMTEAVSRHYNYKDRAQAASQGNKLKVHSKFSNYLEDLAEQLGIGLKVRLTLAAQVARGTITPKTVTRYYKKNNEGHMIESSKTVIESEPRAGERLKALELINKTTGHEDMVQMAVLDARRQLDDMYSEHVSASDRAEIDAAIDAIAESEPAIQSTDSM